MATATQIIPETPKPTIRLDLTAEEAEALGNLLYRGVTGPMEGPRGLLSGIRDALANEGVSTGTLAITVNGTVWMG